MKALDFPLLADENVHPDVIVFLREAGLDVVSVAEQGEFGLPDTQVLQQATETGRVVLTHDSDFGGMAVFGTKFIGIVYLRPGHIRAGFTIKTLEAIREFTEKRPLNTKDTKYNKEFRKAKFRILKFGV